MNSFLYSDGVARPKRARYNGRHSACENWLMLKAMAGEAAAGATKFGGNAAAVYQRVEDNAFHPSL